MVHSVKKSIALSAPEIRGNEWKYIKDCLDSGWVSSVGAYVDRFEQLVATAVGTRYAVATCNGTVALHTALLVAGVQPDDEVLVSTLTFIAPVNAIRYANAWPVFVDAERDYWQLDTAKLADFLRNGCHRIGGKLLNRSSGRCIRAILPVHILGHPVDMDPVLSLAREYQLAVIEDASECLGSRYRGRAVGSLGDIACLSFNGNKIITTGGGGMIVTDKPDWAARAKYLTTQAKDDPVEFVHGAIGYNYRLTNIQAAMGCAQLERLSSHLGSKQRIAGRYQDGLAGVPGLTVMPSAPWAQATFWLYTILIEPNESGSDSRRIMRELESNGIQSRPLWQPIHKSPAHANCQACHCDTAEWLNARALSLPSSVGLSTDDQDSVIRCLLEAYGQRS
jgi:perosamine synthetase